MKKPLYLRPEQIARKLYLALKDKNNPDSAQVLKYLRNITQESYARVHDAYFIKYKKSLSGLLLIQLSEEERAPLAHILKAK